MPVDQIQYSERYNDDFYEYRHVILPPDIARLVPKSHLMTETEWRNLGLQQSPSWQHFMVHNPEPHVLLFRRARDPTASTSRLQETDAKLKNTNNINDSFAVKGRIKVIPKGKPLKKKKPQGGKLVYS